MQMSVITKVWWIVYVVVLLQSALICVQGWQWQRQRSAVMQKTHTTVSSKGQPLHCKDSTSTLQDDLLHTKTKHNDLSSMINGKWRAPVVACLLLSLFAPQTSHATASSADAAAPVATFVQPENTLSKVFTLDSPSPKVQFHYPDDFINAPKLIKTHQEEVFFKSEAKKGFNAGLTVDPVKINSIEGFMTPAQLADKVLQVEKGKEGYINGNINHVAQVTVPLLSSSGVVEGSIPAYSLDYQVESTRGKNHFFVKAIISQQKLFIYTIQCKQLQYFDLQPIMQEMLDSIVLIN